jgi:hypothetical protein
MIFARLRVVTQAVEALLLREVGQPVSRKQPDG